MAQLDDLPDDPLATCRLWLEEAAKSEPNDPNAAALATATAEGVPSVRMVLVKSIDERGLIFFTNAESRKGRQLAENRRAALCLHWKTLRRQVRVEGTVSALGDQEIDDYFHSRSRKSQIGAAVSQQSRVLGSRAELEEQVSRFDQQHPGEVPRPPYWRGYCLSAERIEFWMDGADRLHDRVLFTRAQGGWGKVRLYP